jgi:hypothetical protein
VRKASQRRRGNLWYLTSHQGIQLGHLTDATWHELDFRLKPCEDLKATILQKEAWLKGLWSYRLACQMPILREYEAVFRAIRRTFREANLP